MSTRSVRLTLTNGDMNTLMAALEEYRVILKDENGDAYIQGELEEIQAIEDKLQAARGRMWKAKNRTPLRVPPIRCPHCGRTSDCSGNDACRYFQAAIQRVPPSEEDK